MPRRADGQKTENEFDPQRPVASLPADENVTFDRGDMGQAKNELNYAMKRDKNVVAALD